MFFRQLLNDDTACASYLLGCPTHGQFAVVDPHVNLVDDYVAIAESLGGPIVAVLETHVHADHVSGLPALVERTGATAYVPARASTSTIGRSTTATSSGWATPRSRRSPHPGTRSRTMPTSSPITGAATSRGWC